MKDQKNCPKCNSSQILRVPGTVHHHGSGNNIRRGTIFHLHGFRVLVTRYICAVCGFSEEWIDEKSDIKKIERWVKNQEEKMKNGRF